MADSAPLQLDHLVYAVPDLQEGIRSMEQRLGVRIAAGGRHLQYGTHNALLKIGPRSYLELIAPDPEPIEPRPALWMGLGTGNQAGLIWWAASLPGLSNQITLARSANWSLGKVLAGSRMLPTGETLSWQLTDPYLVQEGGVLPFLIDWGNSSHPTERLPANGCQLVDFQLQHPEPEKIHAYLHAIGLKVTVIYGPQATIRAGLTTPLGLQYL